MHFPVYSILNATDGTTFLHHFDIFFSANDPHIYFISKTLPFSTLEHLLPSSIK